ncbi:MAG: sulfatase-like hydrolase/transferase, partial [Planctomycetota bacterium]
MSSACRIAVVLWSGLLSFGSWGLVAAIAAPPNVVFILSDDQAWTDYSFMGHSEIRTPHLDQLAARSLVFERGYVAAPLCRPSLASIATGLFPFQHGVTGNDVDGHNRRAELDVTVQAGFHQHPSFIKLLTAHNYLAHQSGKWWEGSWRQGGFTHGMTHGDPTRGGRHGDQGLKIGRESMQPITEFIDLAVTEGKPFLLWYAPFLPHTPHNPPWRLLKKYEQPGRASDLTRYFATCEWFDETCGELLTYLDDKGLTANTLVVYLCDNGWAAPSSNAADPHQALWKRYAQRSKGSPYERGIRTPIMISWPGQVAAERVSTLAHAIDIFPTIAAAAGLDAPPDLPGINLLDPQARSEREAVFGVCHSTHNMDLKHPDATLQYLWCVERDWKLLVRYHGLDTSAYRNLHRWDTAPLRLYNLRDDPHEQHDLSAEEPQVAARLKQLIEAWHRVSLPEAGDAGSGRDGRVGEGWPGRGG